MGKYAAETTVSSEQSRAEVERTLVRAGATSFAYGWDGRSAQIGFVMQRRQIRFRLPLPDRNAEEFRLTPQRGFERSESAQAAAYEQAVRQRWRALALVLRAKLEAVDAGISTFEDEFLAAIVLPDGQTVGEYTGPQVEEVYRTGTMPTLLPGLAEAPRLRALPQPGSR